MDNRSENALPRSNKRNVSDTTTGDPCHDSIPSENPNKKHNASASTGTGTAAAAAAAANSADGKSPNSSNNNNNKEKTLKQMLDRNAFSPIDWKAFIKRCKEHPDEVKMTCYGYDSTILHYVVTNDPSLEVVKAVWEAYPWAMEERDYNRRYTPLFKIISHNTYEVPPPGHRRRYHHDGSEEIKMMIPYEIFTFLFHASIGSIFVDQWESNSYRIPKSIFINHIIPNIFPTHILTQKDRHQKTMLHIIVSKNHMAQRPYLQLLLSIATKEHLLETTYLNNETPLFIACKTGAPQEIITDLLKVAPEAAQIRNRFGYLPLHKVCACKAKEEDIYLPLVEPLIHASSDALTIPIQGRNPTPFDLARSPRKNKIMTLLQQHMMTAAG